jgi:hypothetical protein
MRGGEGDVGLHTGDSEFAMATTPQRRLVGGVGSPGVEGGSKAFPTEKMCEAVKLTVRDKPFSPRPTVTPKKFSGGRVQEWSRL